MKKAPRFSLLGFAFLLLSLVHHVNGLPHRAAPDRPDAPDVGECDILIYTEDDLRALYDLTGGNVCLMQDIALTRSWRPIPIFSGSFKGNFHTISDIELVPAGKEIGFFGNIVDTVVQDLFLSFRGPIRVAYMEREELCLGSFAGLISGTFTHISNVELIGSFAVQLLTQTASVGTFAGKIDVELAQIYDVKIYSDFELELLDPGTLIEEENTNLIYVGGMAGYIDITKGKQENETEFSQVIINHTHSSAYRASVHEVVEGCFAGYVNANVANDLSLGCNFKSTSLATKTSVGAFAGVADMTSIVDVIVYGEMSFMFEINLENRVGLFIGVGVAKTIKEVHISFDRVVVMNEPMPVSGFADNLTVEWLEDISLIIPSVIIHGSFVGLCNILKATYVDTFYITVKEFNGNNFVGYAIRALPLDNTRGITISNVGIVLKTIHLNEELMENTMFLDYVENATIKLVYINISLLDNLETPSKAGLHGFIREVKSSTIQEVYVDIDKLNISNASFIGFIGSATNTNISYAFVSVANLVVEFTAVCEGTLFDSYLFVRDFVGASADETGGLIPTQITNTFVKYGRVEVRNSNGNYLSLVSPFLSNVEKSVSVQDVFSVVNEVKFVGENSVGGFVMNVHETEVGESLTLERSFLSFPVDGMEFVGEATLADPNSLVCSGNYMTFKAYHSDEYTCVSFVDWNERYSSASYPSLLGPEGGNRWSIVADTTLPYLSHLPNVQIETVDKGTITFAEPENSLEGLWDFTGVWTLSDGEYLVYEVPQIVNVFFSDDCSDEFCAACPRKDRQECEMCKGGYALKDDPDALVPTAYCTNCLLIDEHCEMCVNANPVVCSACETDYFIDFITTPDPNGMCRLCPAELISLGRKCLSCSDSVASLQNCDFCDIDGCMRCKSNFFFNADNLCVECPREIIAMGETCSVCPTTNSSGEPIEQDPNCTICSVDGRCLQCVEGQFVGGDGVCSICPDEITSTSGLCLSCEPEKTPETQLEGCYVCTEDDEIQVCYQCIEGYSKDRRGGCSKNNDAASTGIICGCIICVILVIVIIVIIVFVGGKKHKNNKKSDTADGDDMGRQLDDGSEILADLGESNASSTNSNASNKALGKEVELLGKVPKTQSSDSGSK